MFRNIEDLFNREIIKGGKDIFTIDYHRAGKFNIEPGTRGIYAWYFFPKSATKLNLSNFAKVINNKRLSGSVKSNFQEEYEARLNSIPSVDYISDMNNSSDVEKAIIASCIMFSPPIYIGRSEDLKIRLEQHDKKLRESLMRKIQFDLENLTEEQIDTDIESKNFGERISNYIINELGGHDSFDNLNFIAVAIQFHSEEIGAKDVIQIENILNRTMKPIFGKK